MLPKLMLIYCVNVYIVASVLLLGCGVVCQRTRSLWQNVPFRRTRSGSTSTESTPTTSVDVITSNLTEIQLRFPGYFRTPEEQARLQAANEGDMTVKVLNVSSVYTRCITNEYCELKRPEGATLSPTSNRNDSISSNAGGRKRRQTSAAQQCKLDKMNKTDLTFNGCCVSFSDIINPDYMETAEPGRSGQVQIAQFGILNQYFEIEECCQARNCTGCQCSQTYYIVSAVVAKPAQNGGTRFLAEYVRVPGCCKCLNTFPQVEPVNPQ